MESGEVRSCHHSEVGLKVKERFVQGQNLGHRGILLTGVGEKGGETVC